MKGISPIVAVVLLIAISIIASVGVWYWVGTFTGKPVTPNVPGMITVNVLRPGEFLLVNVGTTTINASDLKTSSQDVHIYCPVEEVPPGAQIRCGLVGNNSSENIALFGDSVNTVLIPGNKVGRFLVKSWSYPNYDGWSNQSTSVCGRVGGMMGGYGNFGSGAYTYTTLTNLKPGDYTICFDWIKGDSWDSPDNGTLYINGQLVWSKHYSSSDGDDECGGSGHSWNHEKRYTVCLNYTLSSTSLTLNFSSTLDQSATDEWWGIDNIKVYLTKITE